MQKYYFFADIGKFLLLTQLFFKYFYVNQVCSSLITMVRF